MTDHLGSHSRYTQGCRCIECRYAMHVYTSQYNCRLPTPRAEWEANGCRGIRQGRGRNRQPEMRPCNHCGHRRIYHFLMERRPTGRQRAGMPPVVETEYPCSMPECTCSHYSPMLEVASA